MMSLYRTIKGGTHKRSRDRSSCGSTLPSDMVSRRRILSRSRDDLNLEMSPGYPQQEEEEDVWYNRDKLYKDHIQEVLDKWTQIDDEIWAKVIVLEKNRRVAKAYARAPVLTINGSDEGFDGFRIGLCGFDNPMRDQKTEEVKKHIGHGVKVKMDDQGNILVKRVSKCNVYVKSTSSGEETSIGADVLKLPNCALETDKPVKLFDMKKFQANVSRELRRAYPDRRRLECQCLSAIAFVKSDQDLLECPIWVLIINVVAMDMLKSKLPPVKRSTVDIRNRPRIPVPDEDPYSVASNGGGSSGSSGGSVHQGPPRRSDKPPKLPPRDNNPYPHHIPKPDYDDIEEVENSIGPKANFSSSRGKDKTKDSNKHDDPYYCGLRARVPNFVKSKNGKEPTPVIMKGGPPPPPLGGRYLLPPGQPGSHLGIHHMHHLPQQHHPAMWHARSYDSGMDSEFMDSPYNHIYGRLPIPTRGYIPSPRTMYIGEWD
ncbi:expansion isoform X3 [Rhodnius prolixus]|uniref:expansion isoform X3 n=1 Tax=Rhodnius prolixus TaxID=13249 RepID=UPI003D18CD0F